VGTLAAFLGTLLGSSSAFAASSSGDSLLGVAIGDGGRLGNVVLVTVCLGMGYVIVNVIDKRIPQFSVLVASGLEYILVGIVLSQFNLVSPQTLHALSPVVTFGIGSVGLLVGLGTHKYRRPPVRGDSIHGASWSTFVTFVLASTSLYGWVYLCEQLGIQPLGEGYGPMASLDLLVGGMVLGAAATVSGAELIVEVIRLKRPKVGFMSRILVNTAYLTEIAGIVLFGLVFCIAHQGQTSLPREPTIAEWFGINLALGLVLGAIFALFLGRDDDGERLFIAGLGIIVFASGLAYYLELSPIFVNFTVGVVLARFSGGRMLLSELGSIEKPGYIVLFIFLGMAWQSPSLAGWVFAGVFVGVRLLGKGVGAYLTYYYSEYQERYSHGYGLALTAQGGLVAAITLNYNQQYASPLSPVIVNALIVGLLVNELIGRRAVRNALVNANELSFSQVDEGVPMPEASIDWYQDGASQRTLESMTLDLSLANTPPEEPQAMEKAEALEMSAPVEPEDFGSIGDTLDPDAPVSGSISALRSEGRQKTDSADVAEHSAQVQQQDDDESELADASGSEPEHDEDEEKKQ